MIDKRCILENTLCIARIVTRWLSCICRYAFLADAKLTEKIPNSNARLLENIQSYEKVQPYLLNDRTKRDISIKIPVRILFIFAEFHLHVFVNMLYKHKEIFVPF